MNNTPTPKSDKNTYNKHQDNCPTSVVPSLICRQLERELTAARQELDKWEQIANDKLSEVCRQIEKTRVVTEQLTVAREELNTAREDQAYMNKDLNIVTEQRDRLAEALQKLADCDWVITLPDRMDAVRSIAREALAAAKGGADELPS